MCTLKPLCYSLGDESPVPWNPSMESQLHAEYPFLNEEDTPENLVIRRYLETLWLPESLNPLPHLVVSLRRVEEQLPSSSSRQQSHPLHTLLEPLILTSRAASEKYHTELVQILADGGGAGEQEEQMMWFAWNYEKVDESVEADDEKWRKCWLDRLEKREAMIQILLNMLKLSLPGPQPPRAEEKSPEKRRKRRKKTDETAVETDAERLESYMDKLSMWQLTASLDDFSAASGIAKGTQKSDRDWAQAFCEDIVEPLFKASLPQECSLLRSKVFPTSVFTDPEDSDVESILDGTNSRAGSRARSLSRQPSSLGLQSGGSKSGSRAPSLAPSEAEESKAKALQRNRSRSLSVTLMQDEENQRKSFIDPGKGLTRALTREVSMSRVFKAKPKKKVDAPRPLKRTESSITTAKPKTDKGTTLVADTPIRPRTASFAQVGMSQPQFTQSLDPPRSPSPDLPILVEDTPVKSRAQSQQVIQKLEMSPLSPLSSAPSTPDIKRTQAASQPDSQAAGDAKDDWLDENADDSFTGSFGSPDVLLLSDDRHHIGSPTMLGGLENDASPINLKNARRRSQLGETMETPTKKRKIGKSRK